MTQNSKTQNAYQIFSCRVISVVECPARSRQSLSSGCLVGDELRCATSPEMKNLENSMKRKLLSLFAKTVFVCAVISSTVLSAQLGEPPNDFGVRLGHIRLTVKDVGAQVRFWTEAMGGTLVKNGPLTMIQFPGVFILLQEGQ